jgi:sialate O-acetylesterase
MIAILTGMLSLPQTATAEVKLHGLFTDGMVLQQGSKVPVWGTADEGEEVLVVLLSGKDAFKADRVVAKDGKWKVDLNNLPVGGPFKLLVEGKTSNIILKDVYVGEVWVASGQSNMEQTVSQSLNPKETLAKSANPMIRLFQVPKTPNARPQTELGTPKDGKAPAWMECGPTTIPNYSAVAYFFARDLQKARKVPVGIIHGSWGGTAAERWTSPETLAAYPELKKLKGSDLYNGMIVPLMPFAIKGIIWYQGESNGSRAQQYRTLFPAMIKNWRDDWKQGDFPFLFVQLAPFEGNSCSPELREAQLFTAQTVKNTAMAIITDVGHPTDIHPKDKDPVGARLALCARALAYEEKIPYSGPEYSGMKIEGNKVILSFKHVHGGLIAKENKEATLKGACEKMLAMQTEVLNGKNGTTAIYKAIQATDDKKPTDAHRKATLALVAAENKIILEADRAIQMIKDEGAAQAFPEAIDQVRTDMKEVKRRLETVDLAEKTQALERDIIESLKEMIAALNKNVDKNEQKQFKLVGFTICGADKKFVNAEAVIAGDRIIVSSSIVEAPIAVRYGWANYPIVNLWNRADLPATPFRTDDFPTTSPKK